MTNPKPPETVEQYRRALEEILADNTRLNRAVTELAEAQNQLQETDSHGPGSEGLLEGEKPSLPKKEPVMVTAGIGSIVAGLFYLAFGSESASQVPVEALDEVGLWLSVVVPMVVGAIQRRFVYSPATIEKASK